MHSSLLTLLMLAGLLRNLGEGISILHCSGLHTIVFICEKGRNRFTDPQKTAKLLQAAAKNSYRYKRALALTASKAISLILGLLAKNQLYSRNRVGQV